MQQGNEKCVTPCLAKLHKGSTESSIESSSDDVIPFPTDDQVTLQPRPHGNLGMGLYGEIVEVKHNDRLYAGKKYRIVTPEELKRNFEEKGLLGLKHENIVTYCGICHVVGTDYSVVVMERLHQNLETFLENSRDIDLEPQTQLSILAQIARGLAYLHSHSIIHCDLVPHNVLLTAEDEATVKITDYGNSYVKKIASVERRQDHAYIFDYLPPEAFDGSEYDEKIDVFTWPLNNIHCLTAQATPT